MTYKIGVIFDENGLFAGDHLEGFEIPEGCTLFEGDVPDGFHIPKLVDGEIVEGKEFDLDAYKISKIQMLSSLRDEELVAGFISNNYEFSYDGISQTRFTKQGLLLTINPDIDTIEWKTKNNGFIIMTREQFINVLKDASEHEITIEFKYLYVQAYIMNASTKEQVDELVNSW